MDLFSYERPDMFKFHVEVGYHWNESNNMK